MDADDGDISDRRYAGDTDYAWGEYRRTGLVLLQGYDTIQSEDNEFIAKAVLAEGVDLSSANPTLLQVGSDERDCSWHCSVEVQFVL